MEWMKHLQFMEVRMNRKTIVVIAAIGLLAAGSLVIVAFLLAPRFSNGPRVGPGRMMGGGQGQAPGGLAAVSADGKALPIDPNSHLPQGAVAQKVGSLNVSLALSPYPPVGFQTTNFDVTLTDVNGQAVTDATISLDLTMPGMWMPPNTLEAQHTGNGVYHAAGRFTMRDLWRIEIIIQRGSEKQSVFFDVGV
jgi:hypothetical protein